MSDIIGENDKLWYVMKVGRGNRHDRTNEPQLNSIISIWVMKNE